jgi:hypothetical protein
MRFNAGNDLFRIYKSCNYDSAVAVNNGNIACHRILLFSNLYLMMSENRPDPVFASCRALSFVCQLRDNGSVSLLSTLFIKFIKDAVQKIKRRYLRNIVLNTCVVRNTQSHYSSRPQKSSGEGRLL